MPPVTVLRDAATGAVVQTLERADLAAWQKAGWQTPEVFSAKGRDGQTDIWGIIVRPTNFDPKRQYPVIENIYAGPQDSFVPKSFMSNNLGMHELAELGFVVVQIDGMGTSNRSKAFHDVCWKDLKDAGFPDRIKWLEAAARRYPALDLSRVGIYGTSAGGQSAAVAVLLHPEFYKAAVASCGCHDNRIDKMWWNEQWMGYPIGPHYAACANVTYANQLRGNLLLMVGEMDDNVDPASTYQLADALIKANKDFELVVLPNQGHTSGGDFGERKRRDFFVRHLLKQNPPAWSELPAQ
jgi:dipeptidyl aminopeptidase/acylaminoacyl peptidase